MLFVIFMYIIVGLFGLVIGSFMNVCIYRIPEKQSLSFPPSHCMSCGHKLGVRDLFPVFSYLFLGGKCRYCKAKISPQYPVVEALNCIVYIALFYRFGLSVPFFLFAVLSSVMIILAGIDIHYMLLPDKLVLIAAAVGIIYVLIPESIIAPVQKVTMDNVTYTIKSVIRPEFGFGLGIVDNAYMDRIFDALLGAFAGGGVFWVIALATHGNMGGGDIKLMAALGLWFGLKGIAMIFLLAFVVGSVVSLIIMRVKKGSGKMAVAFGPFIILAAFITLFFYSPLLETYLRIAGIN